jgi:hypothetical protein
VEYFVLNRNLLRHHLVYFRIWSPAFYKNWRFFIRSPFAVFRIWMPKRLFKTRTGGVWCGSPSVLDLHFRIAGRIQNKEGTLVASFSTLTAQPAKESTRKHYRLTCDGSLARSPNARVWLGHGLDDLGNRSKAPGTKRYFFFFLLHLDRLREPLGS